MTAARRPAGGLAAGRRRLAAAVVAAAGLLAGCVGAAPARPTALPLPSAQPSAPPAVQATEAELGAALRAAGLVLEPTLTEVRPAEPPSFAGVARWPFHAVLPDDPAGGYLVIYAFPDDSFAADGGRDLAAYVTSGPGRVQFPPDAQFVMRQVGSTIVFYPWSPASSPDPMTPDLAAAIASVGMGVPIPPG